MTGIGTKFMYIKQAVNEQRKDEKTITRIRTLLNDQECLPTFKIPISKVAKAGLILLQLEEDVSDDMDIRWLKEMLSIDV